jgi:hypothetical protein
VISFKKTPSTELGAGVGTAGAGVGTMIWSPRLPSFASHPVGFFTNSYFVSSEETAGVVVKARSNTRSNIMLRMHFMKARTLIL